MPSALPLLIMGQSLAQASTIQPKCQEFPNFGSLPLQGTHYEVTLKRFGRNGRLACDSGVPDSSLVTRTCLWGMSPNKKHPN